MPRRLRSGRPYDLGRKLFDAANEPKTFVLMHGNGHNDDRTEEYYRALETFLTKLAAK